MEKDIYGVGKDFVSPKGTKKVERDLRRLKMLTEFDEASYGNMQEASRLIQDGTYLVFIANHTHHGNLEVFDTIIDVLDPRPEDVFIAVSRRLSEKGQDEKLVRFSQNYAALREPDNIYQVPFVVPKDLAALREMVEKKEMDRQDLMRVIHETNENKRMIYESLGEDAMFMLFPETTTEGGVYDPSLGRRKGMSQVTSDILPDLYKRAQKKGRDIAFVPVSINGFGRVIQPRSTKVSWEGKAKVAASQYLRLDLDSFGIERPIQASVGAPCGDAFLRESGLVQINGPRLQVVNDQTFTDVLMFQVAKGLEPELQGFYAQAA